MLRLLRKQKGENKAKILTSLLENIDAFPIDTVISFESGNLIVRGRIIEGDEARMLALGAIAVRDSKINRIIDDELTFKAINLGVHSGLTPETITFSKAVLYVIQERRKLLEQISQ